MAHSIIQFTPTTSPKSILLLSVEGHFKCLATNCRNTGITWKSHNVSIPLPKQVNKNKSTIIQCAYEVKACWSTCKLNVQQYGSHILFQSGWYNSPEGLMCSWQNTNNEDSGMHKHTFTPKRGHAVNGLTSSCGNRWLLLVAG